MINSYDKQVDIIPNNPGFILSVTKKYDGKNFPFSVTCTLPITFDFQKDTYTYLSFFIETTLENYNLQEGNWNKNNIYTSYSIILKYGCAELNNLVTPEPLRNNGLATAILDIVSDIIKEFNSLLERKEYEELKGYKKIEYIYGNISSCDVGEKLNQEQLINFYRKNGYCPENDIKLIKYFQELS